MVYVTHLSNHLTQLLDTSSVLDSNLIPPSSCWGYGDEPDRHVSRQALLEQTTDNLADVTK